MKIIIIILFLFSPCLHAQIINNYIGNGIGGYYGDGGLADTSEIDYPVGIRIDNSNNIQLATNNYVRKINFISNIITTIAGSDTATFIGNGGPATCAFVGRPWDVCNDRVGNIFISDAWANEIRKVDFLTGTITDYTGTGGIGNTGDGGPATNAKLNSVGCICIDTELGYLYISDTYNHRVRKVNMISDIITSFAGTGTNGFTGDDGPATAANFSRVLGLAVDFSHNLYIGDWDNARIRKVDVTTGIVTTIAGNGTIGYSGDGGPATNAKISKPTAICFDKCGNLYFSDEDSCIVRKIDVSTQFISTIAGNGVTGYGGDGGPATNASFNHPTGVSIDTGGNLYIADYYNQRIRKVKLNLTCDISLGKDDHKSVKEISIFPNPAFDFLSINSEINIKEINILNMVGETVFSEMFYLKNVTIKVSNLSPGIYIVRVTDEEGNVVVRKVLKE